MKIERLSENSIRCTLNRADLDSRELKISELAYGTEKAKSLFKDMIAQASFECGFEAEDIPLMIEAIPVSPDCIVLVITKVEDPEELDTRFSKFAPSEDEDEDDYADMLDGDDDFKSSQEASDLLGRINEVLNSEDGFIPFAQSLGKDTGKSKGSQISSLGTTDSGKITPQSESGEPVRFEKLFSFKNLSQVSAAAAAVNNRFHGESVLYKNPSNSRYYLFISSPDKQDEFAGICSVLTEYGTREKFSYATIAYLEEHNEVIVRKDALKILSEL